MKRPLLLVPLMLLALGGAWIWGSSDHRQPADRAPRSKPGSTDPAPAASTPAETAAPATAESARDATNPKEGARPPSAKWFVREPVYDFGTMDAFSNGKHDFVIRNDGTAPLTLKNHDTTCKCTLSRVDSDEIPPGGVGSVRLEWRTVGRQQYYAHGATLLTNDPKHKFLKLFIRGQVRSFVAAEPDELIFSSAVPGVEAEAETTIVSQSWPEFTLSDISSSLPNLKWVVEPADKELLAQLKATAGYRLRVTLPADLPSGPFSHTLQFQVRQSGDGPPQEFKIGVSGKVLRRLAVYGPEIDDEGTIELGTVVGGMVLKKRLTIKVRDPQTELVVRQIRTVPEFLKVSMTPYDLGKGHVPGLYWLNLEVPANATDCGFTAVAPGSIEMEFDHPRVEPLSLKLKLTVTP